MNMARSEDMVSDGLDWTAKTKDKGCKEETSSGELEEGARDADQGQY